MKKGFNNLASTFPLKSVTFLKSLSIFVKFVIFPQKCSFAHFARNLDKPTDIFLTHFWQLELILIFNLSIKIVSKLILISPKFCAKLFRRTTWKHLLNTCQSFSRFKSVTQNPKKTILNFDFFSECFPKIFIWTRKSQSWPLQVFLTKPEKHAWTDEFFSLKHFAQNIPLGA